MASVIRLLKDLKSIADLREEIAGLEHRGRMAVERLRGIEARVAAARSRLPVLGEKQQSLARREREVERGLREKSFRLKAAKDRQQAVASQRELEAIDHEVSHLAREIDALETEGLELIEALEAATQECRRAELELTALEEESGRQATLAREEVERSRQGVELALGELRNRVAGIPADFAARWKNLEQRHGTTAIVAMTERGACGGCDMALMPATVQGVRACRELTVCTACGRVLYDAEAMRAEG